MYRCSECNAEYEVKPEFCECGNDVFIEIESDSGTMEYEPEEAYAPAAPSSIFEQNSINPQQEYAEEEEEEKFSFDTSAVRKRKVSIAVLACSIILAIVLFCSVGNGPAKVSVDPQKVEAEKARRAELAANIPDVDEFWDNSLPYNPGSVKSSLPIINSNLGSLNGKMKDYMVYVGKVFAQNWKRSYIAGEGVCTIEFTINKDGSINKKKIFDKGHNENLSDSVEMVLSKVTKVDAPPPEYHGERIHLSFQIKEDGKFKVYFPTNN